MLASATCCSEEIQRGTLAVLIFILIYYSEKYASNIKPNIDFYIKGL
jgi:hypothetical protein